eukprot:TRINITY_DN40864_c0_g1_i1.p1 TRINITY_DN40864_c0_g1~~TRINITY_DN40864_c0_g1_i1.p1  ORF type:complete len:110 (-),score=12.55 TRINITY_DN40864_c0_g1_i1:160-489(-)
MWKSATEGAAVKQAQAPSVLVQQNKELRERIAQLEKDHEEMVSLNIDLQEQLEKEKAKTLDLAQQLLSERKSALQALADEESYLGDQRAVLELLQGQIRCFQTPGVKNA